MPQLYPYFIFVSRVNPKVERMIMNIDIPKDVEVVAKDNAYKLYVKPITSARKAPDEQQVRDTFQTPNYAIDLLIPFIPKNITNVWECAAGNRKISRRLEFAGYSVLSTDLKSVDLVEQYNFISDKKRTINNPESFSIITNPPFSIKDLFIEKCFEYGVPFALLINADYSQWMIDLVSKRGCEKIIPTARISYLTPNILNRIHEGELFLFLKSEYELNWSSLSEFKKYDVSEWFRYESRFTRYCLYSNIEEVPQELLYKYSNAQFHSMWLTHGFNLGRTETFVDLSLEQRRTNI